jgi:arylsulfatase A-like enzyme
MRSNTLNSVRNCAPSTEAINADSNVIFIAAWFGMITGLVEGVIFLVSQYVGWDLPRLANSLEIIWIAPLFNLCLFGLTGFVLTVQSRFFRRLPLKRFSVPLFTFMAVSDWLILTFRTHIHLVSLLVLSAGLAVAITRSFHKHEKALVPLSRRFAVGTAAIVVLLIVAVQGGFWLRERIAIAGLPSASPGLPNVLLIVVDTLRADHLHSLGYTRTTSPNMDRIARQGALFENAFSASSYTLPSHASLLTGLYPYQHGVEWDKPKALENHSAPTLAEALRRHGYRTAAFSANLYWFTRAMGFGRGFIRFEDYFHSLGDMVTRTLYGSAIERLVLRRVGLEDIPARKRASDVNRSVLRWIARDREIPFFIMLNYFDAHDPYLPPQPYRNRFSSTKNPGGIINGHMGRYAPSLNFEQVQGEIDAYDGAIAYVDSEIGRLFDELEKSDMMDDLLIVITSDHGEAFGDHGFFRHEHSLYREVLHVPLIFFKSGQVPPEVRVKQPVTNAAIPATVMDLIGVKDPNSFPGPSLTRLWKNTAGASDWPYPLAEIKHEPWSLEAYPVTHGSVKSLVSPKWHYIKHEKFGAELYDRENDIRQLQNLAENVEVQDVLAMFRSKLPPVGW